MYGAGSTCSCRSGAGSPGSEWAKPPDSATLLVSGPRWVSFQRSWLTLLAFSHRPRTLGVDQMTGSTGWSLRFWPTPRLSVTTSMPISIRCSAGPMPDSISSWGLLTAPPDRMTSALAWAVCGSPWCR